MVDRSAPVPVEALAKKLDLRDREHMALVGGGGKTTTLFSLAKGLSGSVAATTTTRMASQHLGGLPLLLAPGDDDIARATDQHGAVLVWSARGERKATGVPPETCDRWFVDGIVDHVVVEADGARQRPFTAPHVFEPVIPASATIVVACIGADALGRVIADQCHRPLRIAAVAGCSPYQRLTPERAARVLLDERGSRKAVPASARFVVAVHQVDESNRPFVEALDEAIGGAAEFVAVTRTTPLAVRYPSTLSIGS